MSDTIYREIRYEFNAGGKDFDLLSFTLDEGLSMPFHGEFKLVNFQSQIPVESMINQTATLKIYQNKKLTRVFSGIVSSFEKGDEGGQDNRYNMTIVPEFQRFSLRHNSRIFQHQSVIEILEVMLKEMRISNYALNIHKKHEKREYCVQYRETDLAFLQRILAEEGVFFYFDFEDNAHTIIFNDYSPVTPTFPEKVYYDAIFSTVPEHPYISNFLLRHELAPTNVMLAEYRFKMPSYTLQGKQQGRETEFQNGEYEYYDYPARFFAQGMERIFADARISYLRRNSIMATGKGDIAGFRPGVSFNFDKQYYVDYNRKWLLTRVRHVGTQPQSIEGLGTIIRRIATYSNEFSVVPLALPWSPEPQTKPHVGGPNVAVVIGPPGEEIYVDEYGRVKVQFKWDRDQTPKPQDYDRTCWIRVSEGWAGGGRGMIALPRVGDEVLVSFLEGDPDRPIITGRTYNAHNRQPYALPAHKTITGIRTKTHRGDGYNELYFDDENEKQLVRIHAEKDYDLKVKNVKNERIDFDHQVSIGNDEKIDVANDRIITVEGEQHYSTKGNHIELREADSSLEIKGDLIEKVAGTHGLRVDGDLTLESMSRLTLKVGGNFVVIDSSGVYINGPIVTVNSGGTPGDTVVPQVPTILDTAVGEGTGFVASCPLQDKANKAGELEAILASLGKDEGEGGDALMDGLNNLSNAANTASGLAGLASNPAGALGLAGQLAGTAGLGGLADNINLANRVLTDSIGITNLASNIKNDPASLPGILGIAGGYGMGGGSGRGSNASSPPMATPGFNPNAKS